MNYCAIVAENIRKYRNFASLTQAELAALAEMSTNHLGRLEREQCSPTVFSLVKLAKQLNISPAYFFIETDFPQTTVPRHN